ncbi:ATP-binding protein, partial [Planktothrix sp. FACHB-1355]|nr:ATP-binding protein [Planktothrix sp. FACHB-1355]
LGVWWLRYAVLHRSQYADASSQARDLLEQCIDMFEQLSRRDVVAKFINALGEAYKRLQQWDLLEMVATKSRDIHQIYPDFTRLAQAYGFLAEVALSKSAWHLAKERAETAIQIILNAQESESVANVEPLGPNLDWVKRWHKSWYLLLLGRSLSCLGQVSEAIEKLETAKAESDRRYAPQLYIEILEKLRELYFQEGRYLEAFRLKQEQSSIEHQYAFRAFIGAGCLQPQRQALNPVRKPFEQGVTVAAEIIALRWQDVTHLIDRLSRSDRKLIVIHGEPGVGKTSLIKAGLVPLLKQRLMEDPAPTRSGFKSERIALPVVLSNYTDWVIGLGRLLTEGLQEIKLANRAVAVESLQILDSVEAIAEQLRINSDRHLLNVLIFDQFEQFFCVCSHPVERRRFYDFLRLCLNLPFVKILLSMREDYLHYLLEWDRIANLDVINNNILDKDMRYYLEKFSSVDAQLAIERLTARAQLQLETALIEELLQDFADERGLVRPSELQMIGSRLEAERITTLAQYRQFGSKEKLVELFLDCAIRDCGTPNEQVARLVLYSLTDDNGNCLRKTRAELVAALKIIGLEVEAEKIDLVLTVLVGVGLVFLQPEVPADRYQLIYGYLLPFIRQEQVSLIVEQLRRERARQRFAEEQLRFVEQANQILIAAQQKAKQIIRRGFVGLALISVIAAAVTILAGFFGRKAEWQRQLAERKEIEALNTVSEARLLSRDRVGALVASVKAGKKLQEIEEPPDLKLLTVIRLHEALYSDKDCERLEGGNTIKKFNFSPDGQTTEYLWHLDKKQIEIKLDELLLSGCDRLRDYLQTNPHVYESDRQLCAATPHR